MSNDSAEGTDKPLVDLPVEVEVVRKGITVYPDGSSVEVHHTHYILHAGEATATDTPEASR